jgi:hypothetical protein
MDLEILKKKISTFRGDGGKVRKVSDEVLIEILGAWEQWTGPSRDFARTIGMNRNAIPKLIGKAKKLKREGFPTDEFKEIRIENSESTLNSQGPCIGIELSWDQGKVIRFPQVDQLIDFLKKVA